jgi:hypothetical protein
MMRAIKVLVFTVVVAWAQGNPVMFKHALCCEGPFTEERAMANARTIARDHPEAQVKIIILTDDKTQFGRLGTSEDSYIHLRNRHLASRNRATRTALYLETNSGVSFDFWDGSRKGFSRKILRGENPFLLGNGIELIAIVGRGAFVDVYCVSSQPSDPAHDKMTEALLGRILPGQELRLIISGSPFHHEIMTLLPFLPVHGWAWPAERDAIVRRVVFNRKNGDGRMGTAERRDNPA